MSAKIPATVVEELVTLDNLISKSKVTKQSMFTSFLDFENSIDFITSENDCVNEDTVKSFIEVTKCVFGITKVCSIVLNRVANKRISTTLLLKRMNSTLNGLQSEPFSIKVGTCPMDTRKIKLRVSKLNTLKSLENVLFTQALKLYTSPILAVNVNEPTSSEIKTMLTSCNLLMSIVVMIWHEVLGKDKRIESLLRECKESSSE